MKVKISPQSSLAATNLKPETAEKLRQRQEEFLRVMDQIKATGETREQREKRIEKQKKEADDKRRRTQKANNLRGRIAFLRSRLMANPEDHTASGELAMAKTQLYWLTNPMSIG